MKTRILTNIFLAISFVFLLGCTRLGSSGTVTISVPMQKPMSGQSKLGKVGAQSFGDVHKIIVNVSGEGLGEPKFYEWDRCSDCATQNAVPEKIEIEVPPGQKIVQLLAVYRNATTNSQDLHYGDYSTNVSGATDVPITLINLNTSLSLKHGDISGRYLTGANTGPTGTLLVKYKPAGKPAMIISRNSIVSGWFSAMIMDGMDLSYEVGGLSIFENVNVASSDFAASNRVARVTFPSHYRSRGGNTWEAESARTYIFGYWGTDASVTSKRVCKMSTELGTQMSYRAENSNGSSLLMFNDSAPGPAHVSVQGGQLSTTGECDTWLANPITNAYHNYLWVSKMALDNNGGSEASGISGMFGLRKFDSRRFVGVVYPSSTTATIRANLLPGVDTNLFDNVDVYQKISNQDSHFNSDSVPCEELAAGKYPYTAVTLAPNSVQVTGATLAVTIPMNKVYRNQTNLVICPKKNGKALGGIFLGYYATRGKYLKWDFDSYAVKSGSQTTLTRGVCHNVTIRLMEGNDSYSNNDGLPINFTNFSSTNGLFNESGTCSGGVPTSDSIASNSNSGMMSYFKATAVGPVTLTAVGDDPDIQFDPEQVFTAADPVLALVGPDSIIANFCYDYKLKTVNTIGQEVPSPVDVYPTINTGGLEYLESNSDCQSASSVEIYLGSASTTVYLKASGLGSFTPTASYAGFTTATKNLTVVGGHAVPESVTLSFATTPLVVGQCHTMTARLTNRAGAAVPAPYAMSFPLDYNKIDGAFYSMAGCTSSTTSALIFSAGYTESVVYFKPRQVDATGNLRVSFRDSLLPVAGTGTLSVSVTLPSAANGAYLAFGSIPSFNGRKVVSAAEFASPRLIPLLAPPGSVIECSVSDGGYSTASCSGVVENGNYRWTTDDISAMQPRWFRLQGTEIRTQFNPYELFDDFKVVPCDAVVSGTVAYDNGTFTTSGTISNRLCMASGARFSGACAGGGLILGVGSTSIVGHSDGTSEIDAGSCGSSAAVTVTNDVFNDSNQTHYLANLKISNLTGSGAGFNISNVLSTQSGAKIDLSGNDVSISGTGSAFRLIGASDFDLTYYLRDNIVRASGASANVGYEFTNYTAGPATFRHNRVISTAQNHTGVLNQLTSAIIGINLTLDQFRYEGPGVAVSAFGYSGGSTTDTSIYKSSIKISGSTSNQPAVNSGPFGSMYIDNSQISGLSGNSAMTGLVYVANEQTTMNQNIFTQFENFDFIRLASSSLINNMDRNQFVYRGIGAPTNAPLNGSGQAVVGAVSSVDGHGRNLFCTAGATGWTEILSFSGLHISSTFDYANSLSRCMKTNDVSPAGFCQATCDPAP